MEKNIPDYLSTDELINGICFCGYCQIKNNSESLNSQCSSDIIAKKLYNLPVVKAKPDFEKKMAARFALELERETHTRNSEWLKRKKTIELPNLITDLQKEFL